MEKKEINDILVGVNPALKKELLNNLVSTLLGANDTDKERCSKYPCRQERHRQVIDMVGVEFRNTDSGVNPVK
jgi:hypothetical protein